jgi:hypothetical protein
MNKTIASLLMFLALVFLLSACSASNCNSGTERQPGNIDAGTMGRDAVTATLCTDKTDYNKGDIVHISFTMKNMLDEQIVLDGGQQSVMDICVGVAPCLSYYQPELAQLTRLVLEPGQSHTIQWDWPPSGVDMDKSIHPPINAADVYGNNIRLDGNLGTVSVSFFYGPRRLAP